MQRGASLPGGAPLHYPFTTPNPFFPVFSPTLRSFYDARQKGRHQKIRMVPLLSAYGLLCARQLFPHLDKHAGRRHHEGLCRGRRPHVRHEFRLFLPLRLHADSRRHSLRPLGLPQHHHALHAARRGGRAAFRAGSQCRARHHRARRHRHGHGHGLRALAARVPALVPHASARAHHRTHSLPRLRRHASCHLAAHEAYRTCRMERQHADRRRAHRGHEHCRVDLGQKHA